MVTYWTVLTIVSVKIKTSSAKFWSHFVKIRLLFILTSGHTAAANRKEFARPRIVLMLMFLFMLTYSSFADDKEGVSIGSLSDDVVALFVERLKRK